MGNSILKWVACLSLLAMSGYVFADDHEKPGAHAAGTSEHAAGDDHAEGNDHAHGEDHAHGDDHGEHGDDHHAHIGDPAEEPALFDPADWRTDLSIYSFIVFLLLLAILKKFAWGPVVEALDAREENIRKNIEDAESARLRAEQLMAEHAAKLDTVQDEVREILAEARRDAEHTKSEVIAAAEKEAALTRDRAREEIDRARDQALDQIFGTMSKQVTEATEHVLGRALNDEDRNRLIDESLAQLSK